MFEFVSLFEGANPIKATVVAIGNGDTSSILDEAICVYHGVTLFREGMNPNIAPATIEKY